MGKRRGFVQMAILQLLNIRKMHGYQIMKELEERSNGLYSASAGTIYPALQELMDQGFIDSTIEKDKKVYTLNEAGEMKVRNWREAETDDFWEHWQEHIEWRQSDEAKLLKSEMNQFENQLRKAMKAVRQQPKRAPELINFLQEATKRLQNF
ncbi:PadR family transcriptional regulator [Peribacillus asahii]|uniref:Transcriptional regulator, PadR family n=1 Tax=Peribacillus asahii TaxID=228899 RepID=A0A3Q9RJJ5_9BACI|nr:PadR family transcriptional regulator [Peribacillus asahii]AZV41001.1 transcriptional regulator, PadR family [Peribacillus asahii]USK85423.1 PadR family transcriptional regulator [Peribacillus asahii]